MEFFSILYIYITDIYSFSTLLFSLLSFSLKIHCYNHLVPAYENITDWKHIFKVGPRVHTSFNVFFVPRSFDVFHFTSASHNSRGFCIRSQHSTFFTSLFLFSYINVFYYPSPLPLLSSFSHVFNYLLLMRCTRFLC